MLDTGTNLSMRLVVSLFPLRQLDTGCSAVRDDTGALVAAIGDHHRVAASVIGTGLGLGPAFVAVAR